MLARLSESRFAKLAQEIASKRSQLQDLTIEQVASRPRYPTRSNAGKRAARRLRGRSL